MTGLNLESFLRLLRADFGAWAGLGTVSLILALMIWTSWGSRRALWKCLALSIVVHAGLLAYGGFLSLLLILLRIDQPGEIEPVEVTERVRIAPVPSESVSGPGTTTGTSRPIAPWDRARDPVAMLDPSTRPPRPPEMPAARPAEPPRPAETLPTETVVADARAPEPERPLALPPQRPRLADLAPSAALVDPDPPPEPLAPVPRTGSDPAMSLDPAGSAPPAPDLRRPAPRSILPAGRGSPGPGPSPRAPLADAVAVPRVTDLTPSPSGSGAVGPRTTQSEVSSGDVPPSVAMESPARPIAAPVTSPPSRVSPSENPPLIPDRGVRTPARPESLTRSEPSTLSPDRLRTPGTSIDLARVTPSLAPSLTTPVSPTRTRRSISEVPTVYRSRLDPNRAALAQRVGASPASEQAVERALDWLARHQDDDGRWDAAVGRSADGTARPNDDSYISHCPPGDVCVGECFYWEADTALTGLALLSYLGAGYTHVDGKYASTVGRGLDFLLASQKSDGDLRGPSEMVGMYCHAMATLALAEAFALTGDGRFRTGAEKGISFLIRSRARDGMSWRYLPGEGSGDTSILGWVVLALRTGKVSGLAIPDTVSPGIKNWLDLVAAGKQGGLARYIPREQPTPSMTAEAWVCRQFLGLGGARAANDEAAAFLLENRPGPQNYEIYYWYYGTLAMFQRGGSDWQAWNNSVRDQLVRRQQTQGHRSGSWDPDSTRYGNPGGRIYATALATLTLEVYYRYLRLNETSTPMPVPLAPRPLDPSTRRTEGANAPAAPGVRPEVRPGPAR